MPDVRWVEALPRTSGTAIPPRTHTVQRAPDFVARHARVWPGLTSRPVQRGTRTPSIAGSKSEPVTATTQASANAREAPVSVISIAAAPFGLPTSQLPARSETGSAAPDAETPRWAHPGRPRSCTVLWKPGATTLTAPTFVPSAGGAGGAHAGGSAVPFSVATNLTRSPAASSAGGVRPGSNSARGVRPMSCQPPGEASG